MQSCFNRNFGILNFLMPHLKLWQVFRYTFLVTYAICTKILSNFSKRSWKSFRFDMSCATSFSWIFASQQKLSPSPSHDHENFFKNIQLLNTFLNFSFNLIFSLPISRQNAIFANMESLTDYSIWLAFYFCGFFPSLLTFLFIFK